MMKRKRERERITFYRTSRKRNTTPDYTGEKRRAENNNKRKKNQVKKMRVAKKRE